VEQNRSVPAIVELARAVNVEMLLFMPYYQQNQPLRRLFSIEKRAPKRAPNLKIISLRVHWTDGGSSLNERLKIFPRACIVAGIQCELMQLPEAAQLPTGAGRTG